MDHLYPVPELMVHGVSEVEWLGIGACGQTSSPTVVGIHRSINMVYVWRTPDCIYCTHGNVVWAERRLVNMVIAV